MEFDSSGGTEIAIQAIRAGRLVSKSSDPKKQDWNFWGGIIYKKVEQKIIQLILYMNLTLIQQ